MANVLYVSVRRPRRLTAVALLVAGLLTGTTSGPASARPGNVAEFPTFTPSLLGEIASGPDGSLWFTMADTNRIGRITTGGVLKEFALPTADGEPAGITAGPDGNVWFADRSQNRVGRISSSGATRYFSLPGFNSRPSGIAAGGDGNLWFTENQGNKIGRITPKGAITEFPVAGRLSGPTHIAAGPDGNVWFTEQWAGKLARITPGGAITEFPMPTPGSEPLGITAGADGNVWFTNSSDRVGRLEVTPAADLSVAQSVSNYRPKVGETVTYGVTVKNHGPRPATAVISDTLPPSMTFVSTTGTAGGCKKPPAGSTGTLTCTTRLLAPGEAGKVVFVARARLAGEAANRASVAPLAPVVDPDVADNTAQTRIAIRTPG